MNYTYGIISTASITPRFIQAVAATQDHVGAIASRSLAKAQEMAQTYDIEKAYGSYEELYQDETIDIVYIALPNHLHVEEARNAILHKKHVLIEKPFALRAADTLSLFQLAQEHNVFLMEAQKSVFLPATKRLRDILKKEELGELCQIQMLSSFPAPSKEHHWMYRPFGGCLYGSASYTIEYLMYLLNNPTLDINAIGLLGEQGAIHEVSLNITVNEEMLANSHITMGHRTHNHAILYFRDGYVEVPEYWKARKLRIVSYDGTEYEEEFPIDFEMIYEVEHIHDCLKQGRITSPIMSAERTILCVQMVEQLAKDINGEEDN